MKKTTMYLPHELILQILLRLPVKSLIRFKCVCKLWFSLISHDPHFANSHFQLTSSTHTRRILFISTSTSQLRSIDFEASLDDIASLNINFILPQSYLNLEFRGSCRGFLVLRCSLNIYLWNPSTGFHKQIPLPPFGSNLDATFFYGFGYDLSTNDYLVVSMSEDQNSVNISSHLEFFSLIANTWKEIECTTDTHFPYMNASDDPRVGSLFNDAIHWLAFRNDIIMNVIVAFHLLERKLFDIHLPDDFDHEPTDCELWVFREFLSLRAMEDDTVEIWVMKEYNMRSSWIKTLVLPMDGIPIHYFSPIYSTSDDIIGTDGGTGLVRYDDKGQLIDHLSYCNDACGSQFAMYTESLLSLNSEQA